MVASTRTPRVTSISDWKSDLGQLPIELPSGKFIRIERKSMRVLIAAGAIPNSLMAIVQESLDKGTSQVNVSELASDPQKLDEMMEMLDNVIVLAVVEPKINNVPKPPAKKKVDLLYVDEIDEEDKAFIFQYVTGGTKNVAQFRNESPELLAAVQPSKVVANPTKSVARPRRR